MTKTSFNCFNFVNLYFPCHFVKTFGLAALSYRLSSFSREENIPMVAISNKIPYTEYYEMTDVMWMRHRECTIMDTTITDLRVT